MDENRDYPSADDRVLEVIFNPELPSGEPPEYKVEEDEAVLDKDEEEVVCGVKEVELEGVRAAEGGRLEEAVELLTRAITMAPSYPSPYNNRAQVYRLRDEVALALKDLNSAVQLCNGRGKVGEQAYCQRGLIHRLQGSEEEARGDFTAAARLGSKYAKKQLVQMNPYAALCGQMLAEAFGKIRRGEQDSSK